MRRLVVAFAVVLALVASAPAEFVAQPSDFHCLLEGHKVAGKNFFVFNAKPGRLKKAIRVAERDLKHRRYPVGTILQFFPFEAMVKRGGSFNRPGHGWEFFQLDVAPEGTAILTHGKDEITNVSGSCQGCHAAAKKFDFVCEGHDVAQLNLPPRAIQALQRDPRCTTPAPAHAP